MVSVERGYTVKELCEVFSHCFHLLSNFHKYNYIMLLTLGRLQFSYLNLNLLYWYVHDIIYTYM